MIEFKECATCAAKSGSPELCGACLHNRATINRLRGLIEQAIAILSPDRLRRSVASDWIDAAREEIER